MPQPIDFPTELARMSAVERIQQVNDRLSIAAQHRSTTEVQEERVASETQVQQAQPQSEEINPELRRRNPYAGRRRKNRKEPDSAPPREEEPAVPPGESHQLDVSI